MPDKPESLFVIEPLGENLNRTAFSCGVEALDTYLYRQASQDARKRAAVPFVATPDGHTIARYYTPSQYTIRLDEIPPEVANRLPRYPMAPVTLLGRLAVNVDFRGLRLGETLLMDALYRSLDSSKQVASVGVIVDAKDESAAKFYRKYGFLKLARSNGASFSLWEPLSNSFKRPSERRPTLRGETAGSALARFKDVQVRAIIAARVARLSAGNFGDSRPISAGASENRIDFGPVYRIYYGVYSDKPLI